MAYPSGCLSSDPVPVPSITGTPASRAAIVVIMTGRKRSRHASLMVSNPDVPGLDRRNHEIADARKIACSLRSRRGFRICRVGFCPDGQRDAHDRKGARKA
jgi:hypothetical protein